MYDKMFRNFNDPVELQKVKMAKLSSVDHLVSEMT